MTQTAVKIGTGGRFVIPGEVRSAIGVEEGDTLILIVEPDAVLLLTPQQAARRAQAVVRRYVPAERSLADELVAERHEGHDAT